MIYLDNASTTQVSPEVLREVMPYLKEQYGNPGTIYSLGRESAEAIRIARNRVASLINANPEQIIFTSGGSEANNMVFEGLVPYLEKINKHHIIVSAVEHDSVLKSAKSMGVIRCATTGEVCIKSCFYISFLPVNKNGTVSVDELENMITDDTGLVSVMYVNNETGSVNQVNKIGELCKSKGVLFHTDCVQAAGCYDIDVKKIQCDFASISAHKIHGLKGVGALFATTSELLCPIINGGSNQEFGLRGGTENVAGIVGFGKACDILNHSFDSIRSSIRDSRIEFISEFSNKLKEYGLYDCIRVNGGSSDGKTVNITIKNIDSETLVLAADSMGVCISAGSACRSLESEPSHVLLAMGLTPDEARDSIRVSFSDYNTKDEVKMAADILASCIRSILNM